MLRQAVSHALIAAAAGLFAGQSARAGTYLIEDFNTPATANSYSHVDTGVIVDTNEAVPNPRHLHAVGYDSDAATLNSVTSGGGALTFAATGAATFGIQFSVAAPGGIVDTTPYNYVRLHFLRLAEGLNLNAEFYTDYSPAGYYTDSAINSGAPAHGGPFNVYIPINDAPGFDPTKVIAFYLGIEGTNAGPGEQFALGSYSLTSGTPEPASWALLLTGFAAIGTAARRRRLTMVAA